MSRRPWDGPALRAHMEATGEREPAGAPGRPADMDTHQGYGVRKGGQMLAGPFAWVENARAEAVRLGGVVACWGNRRVLREPRPAPVRRDTPAVAAAKRRYQQRRAALERGEKLRTREQVLERLRQLRIPADELARALGRAVAGRDEA